MVLRPYFINPNCVLSLRMMEGSGTTTEDSSGYANHGTLIGPPTWVTGRYPSETNDYALECNGTSDDVRCSLSPTLDITDAITLEIWIKADTLTGGYQEMIGHARTVGVRTGYSLTIDNATLGFLLGLGGGGWENLTVANSLSTEWLHIAGCWEGSTQRLYRNGVEIGNRGASGTISTNTQPIYIGADSTGTSFFAGIIDEARIYNRALSAIEILAHYNGGRDDPHRVLS